MATGRASGRPYSYESVTVQLVRVPEILTLTFPEILAP
jgi:hypothetical protein